MRKVLHDLPVFVFAADVLARLQENPDVGGAAKHMENAVFEKLDEYKSKLQPLAVIESLPNHGSGDKITWQERSFTLSQPYITETTTRISFVSISMGADIDATYDQAAIAGDLTAEIIEAVAQIALLHTIDQVRELLTQSYFEEGLEYSAFIPLEEFLPKSEQAPFWQAVDPHLQWSDGEIVSPRLSYGFFMLWQPADVNDPLWRWLKTLDNN